ncbi:MAG: AAA family ATPase, partial [Paludibacteraceae bacterium]|nr:AAA family ATPase [Paludibacteraceae bacterium]
MLKHLSISNYALIGSLDIDFDAGFSVLTGETGAGKSIILGALGLIMGQRADVKVITDGEQKCVIEAEFDIKGYPIRPIFEQNDLDMDPETCFIRRELTAAGKSRAFVNDTPTSLAVLRQLTEHLIDIHSQHENLLLSDNHFQLRVIDTLAHNKPQRDAYTAAYATYKETERQLSELRERAARQSADAEFLQYQ